MMGREHASHWLIFQACAGVLLDEWRRVDLRHFNRGISSVASADERSSYSLAGCHEGCSLGARVIRDANGCISRVEARYPHVLLRPLILQDHTPWTDTPRNIAQSSAILRKFVEIPWILRRKGQRQALGRAGSATPLRCPTSTSRLSWLGLEGVPRCVKRFHRARS